MYKILLGCDIPTLPDLTNLIVTDVGPKWFQLGIQLLPQKDLGVLFTPSGDKLRDKTDHDQCTVMLQKWLTAGKNPTWKSLIIALQSPTVDLPQIAKKLEEMMESVSVSNLSIRYTDTQTHANAHCTYKNTFRKAN